MGSFFPVTPVRDADRLPNGNVLVTGYAIMFEVTRDGDIVWQLQLTDMLTAANILVGTSIKPSESLQRLNKAIIRAVSPKTMKAHYSSAAYSYLVSPPQHALPKTGDV